MTSSELTAGDGGGRGRGMSTTSTVTTTSLKAIGTLRDDCDVTLEVGGELFKAHKIVLAARSPVFMDELFGPTKEEKATALIRIDDMEAEVFVALLHFIYTDSLPEKIDEGDKLEMSKKLVVAADRYRMEKLKRICANTLLSYIDASTVGAILALAEQHGCQELKEASFKFLKVRGNLRTFIQSDGFDSLATSSPSLLKELLLDYIDT